MLDGLQQEAIATGGDIGESEEAPLDDLPVGDGTDGAPELEAATDATAEPTEPAETVDEASTDGAAEAEAATDATAEPAEPAETVDEASTDDAAEAEAATDATAEAVDEPSTDGAASPPAEDGGGSVESTDQK